MWEATGLKFGVEPKPKEEKRVKTKDELLDEEVEKMTREVEETLKLSKNHEEEIMRDDSVDKTKEEVKEDVKDGKGASVSAPLTVPAERLAEQEEEKVNSAIGSESNTTTEPKAMSSSSSATNKPEGGGDHSLVIPLEDKSKPSL